MSVWLSRLFLAVVLLVSGLVAASAAEQVWQCGSEQRIDLLGVSMVPLRAVAESMGATVSSQNGHILVDRGDRHLILTIHDMNVTVNGKAQELPVGPQLWNDTTFVPLRSIGEALGGSVTWDAATDMSAIHFTTATPAAPVVTVTETYLGLTAFPPDTDKLHVIRGGYLCYIEFVDGGQRAVVDGHKGPIYDWVSCPDVSYQHQHVAYEAKRGTDHFLVIDGKETPPFEEGGGLRFSDDGAHYMYRIKRGDKYAFVIDGREGSLYSHISDDVNWSPDGTRVAYVASQGKGAFMVLDGKEDITYDNLFLTPVFSPDSRHFAYLARKGTLWLVVEDGKAGPLYDTISKYVAFGDYSPDSRHLVYAAERNGKWFVVTDGVEGPEYDKIGVVNYSPKGLHQYYVARRADQYVLVIDGLERPIFDTISNNDDMYWGFPSLQFNADESRMGYTVKKGEKWAMVIDGQMSALYDTLPKHEPQFSNDGKHVGYYAEKKPGWVFVMDGRESPVYQDLRGIGSVDTGAGFAYIAQKDADTLTAVVNGQEGPAIHSPQCTLKYGGVSPDGVHTTCLVKHANGWGLIRDGKELTLSPDLQEDTITYVGPQLMSFAYIDQKGEDSAVAVDGVEERHYQEIGDSRSLNGIHTSEDNYYHFYEARQGKQWAIVVNGQESPWYDRVMTYWGDVFDSPTHISFVGLRNGALYKVEMTLAGG